MAVSRTGSVGTITNNANSGSQSVTVPADAELMVVGAIGYEGVSTYFSSGSVTINSAALSVSRANDSDTSYGMVSLFHKVSPSTGTQTLAWDWSGTGAPDEGVTIFYAFYKGIDTDDPIKSEGGEQVQTDADTGVMTAATGDLAVAIAYAYGESETFTWTNATEVTHSHYGGDTASIAEASPSGNITITVGYGDWCSMCGVVLGAGAGTLAPLTINVQDCVQPISVF